MYPKMRLSINQSNKMYNKPFSDGWIHNKITINQKSNSCKNFFDIHRYNKTKTSQESSFCNDRGTYGNHHVTNRFSVFHTLS